MKYAVLAPRGRVLRITEGEPSLIPNNYTAVQITDEVAAQIESIEGNAFLIDGVAMDRTQALPAMAAKKRATRFDEDPDSFKARAKAQVLANLQTKLNEPIYLNGVKVNTDDKTVAELTGMQTAMGRRANLKVDRKVGLEGGGEAWVALTATEIGGMVDAVADHKLAAYAAAKAKEAEIDAAVTLEELEANDLTI